MRVPVLNKELYLNHTYDRKSLSLGNIFFSVDIGHTHKYQHVNKNRQFGIK